MRLRVRQHELRLVGGRVARELAHHAAEALGRPVPVLFLVVATRHLEHGIGRERAAGELLDELGQHLRALRAAAQAVERQLGAALGLARLGGAGVVRDGGREALERLGVVAGVVLALGEAQRRERRRPAALEVLEQAAVAALGVGVLLGLEVDVTHARPGALRDRRPGAVAHDRLPAIHGVAGAIEAQVAQPGLVARLEALGAVGIAAHEVLVGRGGLAVALLVEALVGDVEEGAAHDRLPGGGGVALEQPLLARDRHAVLPLLGVAPGQQLERRRRDRLVGEVTGQAIELELRLGEAPLRGRRVRVHEQRARAPRRMTGRQLLEQQVRSPRELPQIAGAVVGELEHAQRRLDQLRVAGHYGRGGAGGGRARRCHAGHRRGRRARGRGTGAVAVEHDLEVGGGHQRTTDAHQPHAGQVGGGRRLGRERVAAHHRLVGAGGIGVAAELVEAARDLVLGAGRDRVLEVAGQHPVELDDRLGGASLRHDRLAHQELGARRDVGAGIAIDDRAQIADRAVGLAGQESRPGRAQLGLGAHRRVAHAGRDARELLGGAAVVTGGQERVGLGEQRVVAQRRVGGALGGLLEQRRGLEPVAQRHVVERREVGRGRGRRRRRAGARHGAPGREQLERGRRLVIEIERQGLGQNDAGVGLHPRGDGDEPGERSARLGDLATAQRVARPGQPRLAGERRSRVAPLPLDPVARRVLVLARGLERLDRGERGVGAGGVAPGDIRRAREGRVRRRIVAELEPDGAGEHAGGSPPVGVEVVGAQRGERLIGGREHAHAIGPDEQAGRLEVGPQLVQPAGRGLRRRGRGAPGGREGGPRGERDQRDECGGHHPAHRRRGPARRGRHGTGTTGTLPWGPPVEISSACSVETRMRPSWSCTSRR